MREADKCSKNSKKKKIVHIIKKKTHLKKSIAKSTTLFLICPRTLNESSK